MITDPVEVRRQLRRRVLHGYDPERDMESVEDTDVDWFVLSEDEFGAVKIAALDERQHGASPHG
jgi:hypothetical protein